MTRESNPYLTYENIIIKRTENTRKVKYESDSNSKTYEYGRIDLRFYYAFTRFYRVSLTKNSWKNLKLKMLFSKIKITTLDEDTYVIHVNDAKKFFELYGSISKNDGVKDKLIQKFKEVYNKEEYAKKRDFYGIKRAEGI